MVVITIAITPKKILEKNYGFISRHYPITCNELQNFEKDLLNITKSIKFRNVRDEFQEKLKADILNIKSSPNVLVFADKTTNIYSMSPEDHEKLIKENITKTYKKAPPKLEKSHWLVCPFKPRSQTYCNQYQTE